MKDHVTHFATIAADITPQQKMENVLRTAIAQAPEIGNTGLKVAAALESVYAHIGAVIYADRERSPIGDEVDLVDRLLDLERKDIKTAIDSACPKRQQEVYQTIKLHGSLSSARLKDTLSRSAPSQVPEYES